jgi:hypothetical protein
VRGAVWPRLRRALRLLTVLPRLGVATGALAGLAALLEATLQGGLRPADIGFGLAGIAGCLLILAWLGRRPAAWLRARRKRRDDGAR